MKFSPNSNPKCPLSLNFKHNSEITLRNIENGEIIISDSSMINPFVALTKSDSTTIFIEQIEDVYYAYSLNILSVDVDEIHNNDTYLCRISNYPNPFNPSTTIEFSIQDNSKVELSIYNIKGQKIKTITNGNLDAGKHSIIWNGIDDFEKQVSSGVYYYKLNVNDKTVAMKKCLLLK